MMSPLNKEERADIRKRIFLHLDGWALIPTMYNLNQLKILKLILDNPQTTLSEINLIAQTNEGYLNVALRILASQGYINRTVDNDQDEIQLELTDMGRQAFDLANHYDTFYELMKTLSIRPRNIISKDANIEALEDAWKELKHFQNYQNSEIRDRMSYHMEGLLLGPTMVGLGIDNRFEDLNADFILSPSSLNLPKRTFQWFIEILDQLLFITQTQTGYKLNAKGLYFTKRASAYGVTVSYLPTFAQLHTLLKGDPNKLREEDKEGHETHVYRYMNVWGSGGAHSTYFKKVDEIIIELFNKPIKEQPKGLIDVGCGDGSFIEHVFDIIYFKTARGKILDKHPLFIVGADYNQKSRVATRKTMDSADIWAEVEFGDISDPVSLNKILIEKHEIELSDLLNTRTFLDHNRIYQKPDHVELSCKSGGAFAFRGRRIPNNELFQNLSNHLKIWAPYLKKFGLLIIELHSINPEQAANNVGLTLATPYDATHGYTDQYIIELPCFLNAAKEAGLQPIEPYSFRFPDQEKTTVSIQLLKAI